MTWPTNKQNTANSWDSDIQPIIDLFTGVSGGGDQVQITQYNNSTNYAVTIRNLDTTNGRGLKVTDAADSVLLTCAKNAIALGASETDIITAAGKIRGAAGTVALPAFSFTADTDCGLYRIGANNIGVAVNAAKVLDVSTTGLGVTGTMLSGDGTVSLPGIGFSADTDSGLYRIGANNVGVAVNGAKVLDVGTAGLGVTGTLTATGSAYIGDTANTGATLGLTINQAANIDDVLSLKNSGVSHQMTDQAEADTFASIRAAQTSGGLQIRGIKSSAGNAGYALVLRGFLGEAADTTKTTAGIGIVHVGAYVTDGAAGVTTPGADANLFAIDAGGTTRFVFDAEGSGHADVEWIAYDDHDDLALLNALDAAMTRDPIKTEFGRYLADYRQQLQAAKVVNFYDDGPRAMVNFTRLAMLHTGALRQIGATLEGMAHRLMAAEAKLAALPAAS